LAQHFSWILGNPGIRFWVLLVSLDKSTATCAPI
jgi:hypothetical protein